MSSSKVSCGVARISPDAWWVKREEEEPSHSLMSVSTASYSQWKFSCGGSPFIMKKDDRRTVRTVGGAELAGSRVTG